MKVAKYYWRSLLIPTGLILIGNITYIIYDNNWGPGKNYKSEWMSNEAINAIVIQMVLLNALLFAVIMSPIFLMNFRLIQRFKALQFIAWLGLPLTWTLIVCLKIELYRHIDHNNGWIAFLTLPYLVSTVISYIHFNLNKKPW